MTEVERLKGQMCDGCVEQMDRATAKVVKSSATLTIEPGLVCDRCAPLVARVLQLLGQNGN